VNTLKLGWKILEVFKSGAREVWLVAETDPGKAMKLIHDQVHEKTILEILEAVSEKELDRQNMSRGSLRKISTNT